MANSFENAKGQRIVEAMIRAIQENKAYLGEVDGLIGDGDHGMNMNKGFTMTGEALKGQSQSLSQSLETLGSTLFNDIGGSMGPIYGTVFMAMAESSQDREMIDLEGFYEMMQNGLSELQGIVEAQVGDKTLVDTLRPAVDSLKTSLEQDDSFESALEAMKTAAEKGKDSTKDMVAKFGRSSRLGERSRGVLDAGAVSSYIILEAMAGEMQKMLAQELI